MLVKYRQFGTFSLSADQDLQVKFPGRGLIDYPRILQFLKTEIVQSLLGSLALFEARGVELATSRTIKSVWNEAVDDWRRLFEDSLNLQLHKMMGIKRREARIEFNRGYVSAEDVSLLKEIITGKRGVERE